MLAITCFDTLRQTNQLPGRGEDQVEKVLAILKKPWIITIAVLIFFILASGIILHPRTTDMQGRLHAGPDPKVLIWSMAWVHKSVLSDPMNFFRAPIFYPHKDSFAYSDSLLIPSLLSLPFRIFTDEPTVLFNIATWISYILSGFFMYLLVRNLANSHFIGLLCGIFFAFSPFRIDNITHLQYASQQWLPLMILAIVLFFLEKKKRWLFAASVFTWLTAMSCGTYLVMAVIPFGLLVGLLWLAKPLKIKDLIWVAAAGALLIVLLIPFYVPLFKVTQELGLGPNIAEVERFSPDILDFGKQPKYFTSAPYKILPEKIKTTYFSFFPGFLLSAAIIAALIMFVRRSKVEKTDVTLPMDKLLQQGLKWSGKVALALFALFLVVVATLVIWPPEKPTGDFNLITLLMWVVILAFAEYAVFSAFAYKKGWVDRETFILRSFLFIAVLSAFFSLGPKLFVNNVVVSQSVYWPLYKVMPGFKTLRQVLQFNTFFLLFAVPAAGIALAELKKLPKRTYIIVAIGIMLLIAAEYRTDLSKDYVGVPTKTDLPDMYAWLASEPEASPFIELPVWTYPHHPESDRMFWNMYHFKPFVTGQFSYWPVEYDQLVQAMKSFPSKESIQFIQDNYKLKYLVIRPRHYRGEGLARAEELFAQPWSKFKLKKKWDYFWVYENQEWDSKDFYQVAPPGVAKEDIKNKH